MERRKMKRLTLDDRKFFKSIIKLKPQKKNGYAIFVKDKISYKRSRLLIQLAKRIKLDKNEIVHHKNGDKMDDRLCNLEILTIEEHLSLHRNARKNKEIKG